MHQVDGVSGIMRAYSRALINVSLARANDICTYDHNSCTNCCPISCQWWKKYFVLLIIIDGVVTDLQETKDAIVKASEFPLSILIVGVGGADLKEMEVLYKW
ncbi:hypothetical protein Tsubulata_007104 [Turnera subulata]|uniref:Copine C-terminal domain-containing protein n=1 Tax=Turnera subulata TaxID=218843 RepID=A0A9Q0GJT9_9ROSI|nr:hypothetical protein Tsubulata_007104 [Turnera subulata]